MGKNMLIIGAGPGISASMALRFAREGFHVGLIARNTDKLNGLVNDLQAMGRKACSFKADIADQKNLISAIQKAREELGPIDLLHYNASVGRYVNILEDKPEQVVQDFRVNVAGALVAVQTLLKDLEDQKGSVLVTGGGLAINPMKDFGALAIGKAGIRSLTLSLSQALKPKGIYVGSLIVMGMVDPKSDRHSPDLIAEEFWKLYTTKPGPEVRY